MIVQDQPDTVSFLRQLNEEIGRQEFNGNGSYFRDCLADRLVFRRANGKVIRKQDFLDDLRPDKYEILETSVKQVRVDGESAVVDVVVRAALRGKAPNEYRNIRAFQSQEQGWELVAWINTVMQDS